jgi:hypothetical protein
MNQSARKSWLQQCVDSLSGVCQRQTGLEVVAEVVQIDDRRNRTSHMRTSVLFRSEVITSGNDCEEREEQGHADCGPPKNGSSTSLVDEESDGQVDEKRHCLGATVDTELLIRRGDANLFEHKLEIIRQDTVILSVIHSRFTREEY